MIYIREAHPRDGWWLGGGLMGKLVAKYSAQTNVEIRDPQSLGERRSVAAECADVLKYGIRTYVDDMSDSVSRSYAARPTRLYLIDRQGLVAYAGGPGPFGFRPAELKRAIECILPAGAGLESTTA